MTTRTCALAECQTPFEPTHWRQKFCRRECQVKDGINRVQEKKHGIAKARGRNTAYQVVDLAIACDFRGNTREVLPTIENPEWTAHLQDTSPTGMVGTKFSWYLTREEDGQPVERMMVLSHKNGRLRWNKVPVRSTIEGAERNKIILAQSQKLLNPQEPMTLRHLFYMLVSLPDTVISNCPKDYSILSRVMTSAREDGHVDDDSITDEHRTVYKHYGDDTPTQWANLQETTYHKNRWTSQDSYVECWFEKGAVMSVVERLHNLYQVTMRPFKGQASRAYCANIAEDFSAVDKPITVYYFGDHDPSGYAIPRSGERRVREILNGKPYYGVNADFTFIPEFRVNSTVVLRIWPKIQIFS